MNRKSLPALLPIAAVLFAVPIFAIEVTEPAGAAHGYPGLCDTNGKKLADGEFRQWMEDNRLHVVITYKFPDGQFFEENALFRQEPELIQEKWSWKELKDGKPQREFAADFLDQMKMSGRFLRGDNFVIYPEVPIFAKLFIKVPDTHIWLTNPKPAGFLRWEGPIVLPNDRMIRVDLVSDHIGGPAEAVK